MSQHRGHSKGGGWIVGRTDSSGNGGCNALSGERASEVCGNRVSVGEYVG